MLRHLGYKKASFLTPIDVEDYRTKRRREKTTRGTTPAPATLDREIQILKKMLNYAVDCGKLSSHNIGKAELLQATNGPNTQVLYDDLASYIREFPMYWQHYNDWTKRHEGNPEGLVKAKPIKAIIAIKNTFFILN